MTSDPDASPLVPEGHQSLGITKPFSRQQANTAGVTDEALRGSRYVQVLWGVHLSADIAMDHTIRCLAALIAVPEASISGRSAARVWGAVVPDSADIEIVLKRKQRTHIRGIRVHRPAQRPKTTTKFGVRLTTPEATSLRLASELELVDLVVAGDSLVKKKRTTPEALRLAAKDFRGRNARLARTAAGLVRAGVDSPQETRVRLLIVLAGLPEPEVNIEFCDDDGNILRRLDMGYRAHRLGIEYDGRQHAENDNQWQGDVRSREEFDERGWRLIVLLNSDVFTHPDRTIERLVAAMRKAGMMARAGQAGVVTSRSGALRAEASPRHTYAVGSPSRGGTGMRDPASILGNQIGR